MQKDKSEAARKAKNAYMKKWRAANPDKVKANTERYWARQAERMEAEQRGAENNG